MGEIRQHPPVLFLLAVFSRRQELLCQVRQKAVQRFGPLYKESAPFLVDDFTHYYDGEMGTGLTKQLWTFERLIDPGDLAALKVLTNSWEEEFPPEPGSPRPVNLDPGYIDLGKLILASTKDHAHRIYLGQGIFAETTLMYRNRQWQALPWSYPDYQSPTCTEFLTQCRDYLHACRRALSPDGRR